MSFTVGSLFDGSGGFPLAAFMCGGVPVWASEIEPYPIAVTKTRFPYMKHLGSVTDVKGNEVKPVDVISFGSPCQDLSVAGLRKGLKHEDNGDDETTRSGLFMEAVRIIKEMREATNGRYPTFAIWENVHGAFSSNKGEDFRIVLEELIKIVEPSAVMPTVPKAGWSYADSYCGDGWSLAYRVFDAQYWGVPQRRRRIYLVLDLRGERAREVLFEREGLRGYFEEGRTPWQGVTPDVERGVVSDDCERNVVVGLDGYNATTTTGDVSATLGVNCGMSTGRNGVITLEPGIAAREGGHIYEGVCGTLRAKAGDNQMAVCYDARGNGDGDTVSTITGDHNNRVTDYTSLVVSKETIALEGNGQRPSHHGDGYVVSDKSYTLNTTEVHGVAYGVESPIVLDRAFYNQGQNALYEPQYYEDGLVPPIVARGPSAVAYSTDEIHVYPEVGDGKVGTLDAHYSNFPGCRAGVERTMVYAKFPTQYVVRRLTPTECARLQGFMDGWGIPDKKTELTDEEYEFWLTVRNTHAEINGKTVKNYTRDQMLTWYNKLHTDSSEYKLWGNGIALPNALYVMQGIAEILN